MKRKMIEKELAINLRSQGMTLSEIRTQVPVAKSTLSLWLREVGLARPQQQRLTEKKLAAGRRGGAVRRAQRLARTAEVFEEAQRDVGVIARRELWLMGVMLYWAEGSKAKSRPNMVSTGFVFTNSDPKMIKLMLKWLRDILDISIDDIRISLYIHESRKAELKDFIDYWSSTLCLPKKRFAQIYFKKSKRSTNRKNIGDDYRGILRLTVCSSSVLNRRIEGWVRGVCSYYWGIV